ncbi:ArsR/SmtB family transcription factor [Bacillus sp. V33-4]|uniref:ArsR/SmtB family transcription factor n=1 Tax=Bacillus sp. V33-4 TaxID=2054169 RepID=UPI000C785B5C|nr:metalloregulator ArsR/SmtB family transcription factor [Bacillus sp. V33-4]PLR85643.1 transcriptional regulator [Bacillus sp. V33-4]
MNANPNIAIIASIVSEASRAAILTVLLDGRFHPASELAYMAGIKPQTASFHLHKMVDANIITVEKQGRHRYYGIRNPEVAQVMESLLSIAPTNQIKSFKQAKEDKEIRAARTCYDHLAGNLGVKITDSLISMGMIKEQQKDFIITEKGEQFFLSLQIDIQQVKRKRRSFSHKCLDWTERRPHLAGALGNALFEKLLELKWIKRIPQTRAIKITSVGKTGLKELFSIDVVINK